MRQLQRSAQEGRLMCQASWCRGCAGMHARKRCGLGTAREGTRVYLLNLGYPDALRIHQLGSGRHCCHHVRERRER